MADDAAAAANEKLSTKRSATEYEAIHCVWWNGGFVDFSAISIAKTIE